MDESSRVALLYGADLRLSLGGRKNETSPLLLLSLTAAEYGSPVQSRGDARDSFDAVPTDRIDVAHGALAPGGIWAL